MSSSEFDNYSLSMHTGDDGSFDAIASLGDLLRQPKTAGPLM